MSTPHGGHVFRRIKILQTIFEKGHPRNIPVIYFKIGPGVSQKKIFFKKILHVRIVQKSSPPPPPPPPFFHGSKFLEQFLKSSP